MKARRVDRNHSDIVAALRAAGCSVLDLSGVGKGCPDLLVGRNGVDYLLEVKAPGGKTREAQRKFSASWRGHFVQFVTSELQALAAVGALKDARSSEKA